MEAHVAAAKELLADVYTRGSALGATALEGFELRVRSLDAVDVRAPQTELELVVLAVAAFCLVHALLARRMRAWLSALPFVLACHSLVAAADTRVSAGEMTATTVYASAGFSAMFRGVPLYVFVARAALVYIFDATARVVYRARLLAVFVAWGLALLAALPLEMLCALSGFCAFRSVPAEWALQWGGVPFFAIALFWVCTQGAFTLAHELVDSLFPPRPRLLAAVVIAPASFATVTSAAVALFAGLCVVLTFAQIRLHEYGVSDALTLAMAILVLILIAGAAAGRARPSCAPFAFVLPPIMMAFILGSAGRTYLLLCNKSAEAEHSPFCSTPDGLVAFAFCTSFAAALFALPLLSGQRIAQPIVSPAKPKEVATAAAAATASTSAASDKKPPKKQKQQQPQQRKAQPPDDY